MNLSSHPLQIGHYSPVVLQNADLGLEDKPEAVVFLPPSGQSPYCVPYTSCEVCPYASQTDAYTFPISSLSHVRACVRGEPPVHKHLEPTNIIASYAERIWADSVFQRRLHQCNPMPHVLLKLRC